MKLRDHHLAVIQDNRFQVRLTNDEALRVADSLVDLVERHS